MPRAVALALAVLLATAVPSRAAETVRAAVSYVTTTTVYVDAGTEAGLAKGEVVEVRREGLLVTWLEVTALSSKRASCRRVEPDAEIRVGDAVTFRPVRAGEPVVDEAPKPEAKPRTSRRDRPLRGRIDVRYLGLVDGSSLDRGYSEPGVDVRADGRVAGEWRVSVDARARRTYRPDEDTGRTRVYRLLAEYGRPTGGAHAALGRQVSTSLSSVGVFDGVMAEWRGERWGTGGFFGYQPDPRSFGTSTDIREHGVWIERGGSGGRAGLWRLTLAAVGSYAGSTIDREYFALQGRMSGGKLEAFAVQEVDLARGWKRKAGEDAVTATSALVNARWRFADKWSVDGGADTRRNVRLYRNLVTPETDFDDAYRNGYWSGLEYRPARRASVAADFRRAGGGSSGGTNAYTLRGRAGTARFRSLTGSTRTTRYTSDRTDGWLLSGTVGMNVTNRAHVGASLGERREHAAATGADTRLTWVSLDTDVAVGRSWLVLASVERSRGAAEKTTQIHASAGWRF